MSRRALLEILGKQRADIDDPLAAIESGEVLVDGVIVTNPKSQVREDARIVVKPAKALKGEAKLAGGVDALGGYDFAGKVGLDVGASTGGFTTEMLRRGAAKVFAVDVGHGQLMGALRQDGRVVNLESTNATDLTLADVPDPVEVMTIDVSYSPLRAIVPGVTKSLRFAPSATMFALVKPMFELQAAELPTEPDDLAEAVERAESAVVSCGWTLENTVESPLRGNAGAIEYFIRARLSSL